MKKRSSELHSIRRSPLELKLAILTETQMPTLITRIEHDSYVNHCAVKRYLEELIQLGMIEKKVITSLVKTSNKRAKHMYKITDLGRSTLATYKKMEMLIECR